MRLGLRQILSALIAGDKPAVCVAAGVGGGRKLRSLSPHGATAARDGIEMPYRDAAALRAGWLPAGALR